jgi:type IX secretion system PorP/SprF family membrane protein
MKRSFLLLLLVGSFVCSMAQSDPLYAQYLNNSLLINPAYSGLNNNFMGSVTFRKQWAGFDGSPTTMNVNGHMSLFDNRMGAGLIVLKDQVGASSNTEVHATYAYRLDLDQKFFSFGLQAGMVNFRTTNGELNPYDQGDPVFTTDMNITKPSFGAGAILHSDRYFIGLSVPRLLKARTTFNSTDPDILDVEAELYNRHFYLMGAYMIFINENIRLKPSMLIRGVKGAKISTDLNMALNLNEKYTAGIFTRNFSTYGLLAQMKLGTMYRFGYTFEVPTGNSVGARFTTHEFMIGINLSLLRFHDSLAVINW